ncbi:hypothetical protein LTR86_003488 [Recurvomyces mirabilis]|nr:hypothetical protein LTR86_003488 [Recurvomyces mirabilis]
MASHRLCRCLKAGRQCEWEDTDAASLAFRDETSYARGQPRRPRKQSHQPNRKTPSSFSPPTPIITRALQLPLEVHAFQYWITHFTSTISDGSGEDIGHSYCTHALQHYHTSPPTSSLPLAVAAFSHGVFGRARNSDRSLHTSQRWYARAVVQIRNDLNRLGDGDEEDLDALILSTMLLAGYSNATYPATTNTTTIADPTTEQNFWTSGPHLRGTTALLQLKAQCKATGSTDLERSTRGIEADTLQLKACLNKAEAVPYYSRDSTAYFPRGPQRGLDVLQVRVTDVRARYAAVVKSSPSRSQVHARSESAVRLLADFDEVHNAFVDWMQGLPMEWHYSKLRSSVKSPDTLALPAGMAGQDVYTFTDTTQAILWLQYHALHLVATTLYSRLPRFINHDKPWQTHPDPATSSQAIPRTLNNLTSSFILTIPSFYHHHRRLTPRNALMLAWPLTVAVGTKAFSNEQEAWLQGRLDEVAEVTGAQVLRTISHNPEFWV